MRSTSVRATAEAECGWIPITDISPRILELAQHKLRRAARLIGVPDRLVGRERTVEEAGALRGLDHLLQLEEERTSIRQAGQAIVVRQLPESILHAPLATTQCQRQLPHFVGMKRLLQVEELVGGRDSPADVGRVHVGVGGADDDLHLLVDLADPACVRRNRERRVDGGADRLAAAGRTGGGTVSPAYISRSLARAGVAPRDSWRATTSGSVRSDRSV